MRVALAILYSNMEGSMGFSFPWEKVKMSIGIILIEKKERGMWIFSFLKKEWPGK